MTSTAPARAPERLLGFLGRWAWLYAVLSAVALLGALVVAVSALGAAPDVVGRAQGGTVVLQGGGPSGLRLYGTPADGRRVADVRCELQTDGTAFVSLGFGGSLQLDGAELPRLGGVTKGWRDGDTLTCAGVTQLAVTQGTGPLARLALAGLLLVGALMCSVLALVGRRSRRRTVPG